MKENTWRKKYPDRICKNCGNLFSRSRMTIAYSYKKQVTCSKKCKGEWLNKKLLAGIKKKFLPKECEKCRQIFQPKNQAHRFCGSKVKQYGCSWKHYLEVKKKKNSLYRMYGSRKFWLNTNKIIYH